MYNNVRVTFTEADNQLISWFKKNRERCPKKTFKLSNYETVRETEMFYDLLDDRISKGNTYYPGSDKDFRFLKRLKQITEGNAKDE